MKKSLSNIRHDLIAASQRIDDYQQFQQSLIMICHWIIESHDNPADAPQSLAFQIKQLKDHLDKGCE